MEHDAQYEIQKYAEAVLSLTKEAFPETIATLYE
jgi:thymidylate synthase ThyX